jgi:DNA-directed RNA polymerase specialized sigma24 family protein
MAREELKKRWSLHEDAFRRLLAWLDEGTDSGGLRYLEMRERLVSYFDRRNCPLPDDLADETLNLVARRLEEEEKLDAAPAHFCYLTARFVLLESLREPGREAKPLPEDVAVTFSSDEDGQLLDSLEQCLQELAASDRALILEYYEGQRRVKIERRRELAERLGISMNALAIRATRIRTKLERCLTRRMRTDERDRALPSYEGE